MFTLYTMYNEIFQLDKIIKLMWISTGLEEIFAFLDVSYQILIACSQVAEV